MSVVKNLMVRAGADFSPISRQAKKAAASMRGMESGFKKSCSVMSAAASKMNKAFSLIGVGLSVAGIAALSKSAKNAYDAQAEAEAKLAQVMRNTIGASAAEIKSIKELASAQQALGVIGDEVQLAGAQELATYVSMTSTLKTLIPVMNDMAAQQYGLKATAENTAAIATMLGKVMSGQTSGLSRYGYYFTKAEESILKYGDEAQRAATLAKVVEQSVGGMNAALAATPSGRLKQVSNTLGDIKEKFGQAVTTIATVFLPVLNAVCSMLANAATLANKVAQAIANVFGRGSAKSTAAVVSYTAAASSAMDGLAESTQKAGAAAKKNLATFSFDTLNKLSAVSGSSGSGDGESGDGSGAGGLITETAGETEEAAESIGWLEKALARIKETIASLNFDKLADSFQRLKEAAAPLGKTLFAGLEWLYTNILEPLAHWTVEDAVPMFLDMLAKNAEALTPALAKLGEALKPLVKSAFDGLRWAYENVFIPLGTWVGTQLLPAFLDVLAAACRVLSAAVEALKPLGLWLWEKFLKPLASWTGGVIVDVLKEIADGLSDIASVISGKMSISDFISQLSPLQSVFLSIASAIAAVKAATAGLALAQTIKKIVENISKLDMLNAPGIIGKLANVFTVASSSAYTFSDAVQMVFGPSSIIAGIAGIVGGAVLAVTNFLSMLKNGFSWANEALMVLGISITAVGAIILGAPALVTGVVAGIVAAVATAAVAIRNHWEEVKTFFVSAWERVREVWGAAEEWFRSTVVEPIKAAWSAAMEAVKALASAAWTAVQSAWSAAAGWFSGTVMEPIKAAWTACMETVKALASAAWAAVQNAWSVASGWFSSTVMEPIKTTWSATMEAVKALASSAWVAVQSAWSVAAGWFSSTVMEPIKAAWTACMETVKSLASSAWAAVQSAWSAAGSWFSSTVAEPIKSAWSAGMEAVKSLGSSAWESVKSAWSGAAGWFKSSVTDPISNGFRSFANTVIGFFQGLANGAISGVNGIISALNRIHIDIPDWVPGFGGRSWGFNLPAVSSVSLPRLANGAVFEGNNPYLAVVNDQKHGINVESPLSTIVEAMLIALRQMDLGGGDIQVNIRAVFEGQLAALARYLRPYFEAEASRIGPRASKGGT